MATARLREARRAHQDPDTTPGPPALPTIFSRANKCLSLGQIPEGSGDYLQCLQTSLIYYFVPGCFRSASVLLLMAISSLSVQVFHRLRSKPNRFFEIRRSSHLRDDSLVIKVGRGSPKIHGTHRKERSGVSGAVPM